MKIRFTVFLQHLPAKLKAMKLDLLLKSGKGTSFGKSENIVKFLWKSLFLSIGNIIAIWYGGLHD